MFVKQRRQSGVEADRRGPSDFGGSVMSLEDFRSARKEPTSMKCGRWKE